jgi:pimeloyl-ACP methyl ester carboxylesterase
MKVEVDGAVLSAQFARGADPSAVPVVFLHAGVADSRMWDAQQAAVSRARSTLRYDRRGFGASAIRRPAPHSHAGDLRAVLDAHGVQRAAFVACSQGGRIALDLALADPGRVASLLLVAPAVSGAPQAPPKGPTARLASAIEAAEAAGGIERINELEARLWLDGPSAPAGRVGGAARALFLDMNGKALRSPPAGDAVEPPPAWQRLQDLRCPVWVLWGTLDLPLVKQRCETLVQRIRGARRVVLPGVAHLPCLEAPQRFNAVLHAFLSA